MDYNSRIRWKRGMMLTEELFTQIAEDLRTRQQIAVHAATGYIRTGILPDTPLHAEGIFVRRVYEMTGLQCTAVLPSGRIISVNADLKLPINIASDEDADYYVALGFGSEMREYEKAGVAYVSPQVELSLITREEMEKADVVPLKHFYVREGALNVDYDYIPPTFIASTDPRIATYINGMAETLKAIATHENMDNSDCKRAITHYSFLLRAYNTNRATFELQELLVEIAQAIDYYIVEQLGATIDHVPEEVMTLKLSADRTPKATDIAVFLKWLTAYIKSQLLIMEKVVIVKPDIDIEAIKQEIKEAVYADLHGKLSQELMEQLSQQLKEQLPEPIIERVKQYLDDNMHPELRSELHDDLRDPLYNDIYDAIMKALNDMLANLQFKEIDNFVPLI